MQPVLIKEKILLGSIKIKIPIPAQEEESDEDSAEDSAGGDTPFLGVPTTRLAAGVETQIMDQALDKLNLLSQVREATSRKYLPLYSTWKN